MTKAELPLPQKPQKQTRFLIESVQSFFRIHVAGEYHSPAERQEAKASGERVGENQKRLEIQLPPSTHADHTRMTW